MQKIAARVGYSETAFLVQTGARAFDVRYFSPQIEVPFCGHATIASAVALAERIGAGQLLLQHGRGIDLESTPSRRGPVFTATLTSVAPQLEDVSENDVNRVLEALRWERVDLDPRLPRPDLRRGRATPHSRCAHPRAAGRP